MSHDVTDPNDHDDVAADTASVPDEGSATADGATADPAAHGDETLDADTADDAAPADVDWEELAAHDERSGGELLATLHAATVERDDFLDQLRRKQAEFDNFRKRMARDAERQRQAGKEAVALSLLEVIDDFDRTLAALGTDDAPADGAGRGDATRKGVALVRDKLVAALRGQGLEPVEAAGALFDPTCHEAVQQVPGDGGDPVVAEVLRTGWRMHDRVLRAAMVVVAQ